MRDYIYIWNDPANQCVVASGIEFRDIAPRVGQSGGLILAQRDRSFLPDYVDPECIEYDVNTRFEYVPRHNIPELAEENIYSWGDFSWVDYAGEEYPPISDQEVAELAYFGHIGRPLGRISMPSLRNKYLCYQHDDGWYMRLFYYSWEVVDALLSPLCPQLNFEELRSGSFAYWVQGTRVEVEELSHDVDAISNRRLDKHC